MQGIFGIAMADAEQGGQTRPLKGAACFAAGLG